MRHSWALMPADILKSFDGVCSNWVHVPAKLNIQWCLALQMALRHINIQAPPTPTSNFLERFWKHSNSRPRPPCFLNLQPNLGQWIWVHFICNFSIRLELSFQPLCCYKELCHLDMPWKRMWESRKNLQFGSKSVHYLFLSVTALLGAFRFLNVVRLIPFSPLSFVAHTRRSKNRLYSIRLFQPIFSLSCTKLEHFKPPLLIYHANP